MKSISDLITKLGSDFPWIRKGALNNLVKIGLPAVKEIITAFDTPYMPICINVVSSDNTEEFSAFCKALNRWPLLIDALVKIGKQAYQNWKMLRIIITRTCALVPLGQ